MSGTNNSSDGRVASSVSCHNRSSSRLAPVSRLSASEVQKEEPGFRHTSSKAKYTFPTEIKNIRDRVLLQSNATSKLRTLAPRKVWPNVDTIVPASPECDDFTPVERLIPETPNDGSDVAKHSPAMINLPTLRRPGGSMATQEIDTVRRFEEIPKIHKSPTSMADLSHTLRSSASTKRHSRPPMGTTKSTPHYLGSPRAVTIPSTPDSRSVSTIKAKAIKERGGTTTGGRNEAEGSEVEELIQIHQLPKFQEQEVQQRNTASKKTNTTAKSTMKAVPTTKMKVVSITINKVAPSEHKVKREIAPSNEIHERKDSPRIKSGITHFPSADMLNFKLPKQPSTPGTQSLPLFSGFKERPRIRVPSICRIPPGLSKVSGLARNEGVTMFLHTRILLPTNKSQDPFK